ncbi:hypothetical protein GQ42DRAFT_82655 [Ramicandelaber brevisporus]|nr:hypothetical protein GQ42DRAFT_82655 [Ramicandelaber brevisporus]
MFSERLDFIRQSIQRSDHFTESGVLSFGGGQHTSGSRMRLSAIKSLLGRDGDSVLILGLLARKEDGRLCLEDESGRIPLVFPEVLPKGRVLGLFTENCVVLAEGTYEDGELTVAAIGHPPLEPRQDVRMLLNGINYFGGPQTLGTSSLSASSLAAGRRLGGDIRLDLDSIGGSSGGSSGGSGDGSDDGDHTIVVLSDIHLDDPDTLAALRTLFAGFSATPPTAFVLCGNFLSTHGVPGSGFSAAYQAAFAALASLIAEHRPLMQRSHFVVVPGPSDPWTQGSSTILPRRPLPASLTSAFREKVPHAVFASNPCRILIRSRSSSSRSSGRSRSRSAAQSDHEMVVFRADLVSTIQRNCVIRPPHITANKFPMHVAQLVVRQSHLYPLPLRVCPVLWGYEHALRLYPAPDAVILADKFEHYSQTVEIGSGANGNASSGSDGSDAVNVINPGSFSSSTSGRRFGFFVYQTGTRAAQVSYVSSTR